MFWVCMTENYLKPFQRWSLLTEKLRMFHLHFLNATLTSTSHSNSKFKNITRFTIWMRSIMQFFVVHAGVGLLAIIFVAVFLDNIDRDQAREFRQNKGNKSFCSTFLATFTLLKDPKLLMLIPLTMYSGFEQSFLSSEYTKVHQRLCCVKSNSR